MSTGSVAAPRRIQAPAGRPAVEALARAIAEAKGGDPLAPVTVLVPSSSAGLNLRRLLGSGAVRVEGAGPGLLNVRFAVAERVTELLGAPSLAAEGRRPLSPAAQAEAVRVSLAEDPGVFAAVADHPSTEGMLEATFAELRGVDDATLDRLSARNARSADVVRLHRATRARLARDWYDPQDQLQRAVEVASGRRPDHGALADLGTLVVHVPRPGDRAALDLAAATGGTAVVIEATVDPAPVGTRIVSTSDDDDEVRAVTREVLRLARGGVALHRIAVAHPGGGYPRLLHQSLRAAGIAHHGPGIRTLADTVPGQTLLGLLTLRDQEFRREDLMAWLAAAPVVDPLTGTEAPGALWDALSRRAGVVGGAANWHERLTAFMEDQSEQRAALVAQGEDQAAERRARRAERAGSLRTFVAALAAELTVAENRSWAEHVSWARDLLERYLGSARRRLQWPDQDQTAWDQVQGVLDGLAGLDVIGRPKDAGTFRRAVERDLARPAERIGRAGTGVLVTAIPSLRGHDVDAVIVCGLAEGRWPGRPHDHPLLPDRDRTAAGSTLQRPDPLVDQREAYLHALAAASGERILTVPRAELGSGRELLPSRWLLDTASHHAGERIHRGTLHGPAAAACVTTIGSFVDGIIGQEPASLFERDLGHLLRWTAGGGAPAAHPLATERPQLGAGWAVVEARATGGFGPFEGQVETAGRDLFDPDRPLSPTALETYAACPRRYFLNKVLDLRSSERPEEIDQIDSKDRGSLVHEILEQYVAERIDGAPPSRERLLEIARAHFEDVDARGITGRPLRWTYDKQVIERELARFHRLDVLQPLAAELHFGMGDEPPVDVTLPSGRRLRFKGSADRVDLDTDGGLVVTDYKTGSIQGYKDLETTHTERGTKLQLPTYALAARDRHGREGQALRSRYWFTSERGQFQSIGYDVTDEIVEEFTGVLDVIVAGIDGGRFPARPGKVKNWPDDGAFENCRWCDFHAVCPTDRGRAWERVRTHPTLADYVRLAEGEDDPTPGDRTDEEAGS